MAEDGKTKEEKRKQIKSLTQEGEVRRKNGQSTDAIRLFTEALEIDGEYAWAYAHRGAARAALDGPDPEPEEDDDPEPADLRDPRPHAIARAAVDPDVLEHIGWDGHTAPGADPTHAH
ncbi:hypothetical protein WME99_13045 [Sorangium sp. So ce136]|uniref:hypothetical protein n=1 Tax=Sorangium sp. So ce136 TaxID=3133284 RepID=UPI003F129FCC